MDLQGAELNALKGLGNLLKKTKYIISEVSFIPQYYNQCTFKQIDNYLTKKGFFNKVLIKVNDFFGDAFYINKDLGIPWTGTIT